ncbi:peroxynitrite isomerase THAP4-like isoform X2 [Ornithodoros turicata]|uniref:peroxynitrite isomerase THAP4-like isoform X2 n=1 Tax=Ornithodoros turicata TaxID=34597 RepID=UPI003139EF01
MPCAVPGCVNKRSGAAKRKCLLHRIPKNEPARSTWLKLIDRHDIAPGVGSRICHLHFTPDDYVRNTRIARSLGVKFDAILKRDVSPSQNLPGTSQPSKRHKAEDSREAASISGDPKRTSAPLPCELGTGNSDSDDIRVTEPYSEEGLAPVPTTVAGDDAPTVPAVHSMELSTLQKHRAQALPEHDLMCQDVSAANVEAYHETVDEPVTVVCPMIVDAATQTMSTKYKRKATQVDFCVKSLRETGVQVNLIDDSHPSQSPVRCPTPTLLQCDTTQDATNTTVHDVTLRPSSYLKSTGLLCSYFLSVPASISAASHK